MTSHPYLTGASTPPRTTPSTTSSSSTTAATVLTKVAAVPVGLLALVAALYGGGLLFLDLADGNSGELSGVGIVIGLVILTPALPVLGLCTAVVLSRNRTVVAVCGILVALVVGPAAALLGGGQGVLSLGGVALASVLIGSGVWSLLNPQ